MCWIQLLLFSRNDFLDLLLNLVLLSTHILFCLRLDSSNIFWNTFVVPLHFLSFKGITYTYLLKISITHNQKQTSLLDLFIYCISVRLAPKILSIKGECTFLFLNFLIIGLRNSSANTWIEIFLFLIPLPEAEFSYLARAA